MFWCPEHNQGAYHQQRRVSSSVNSTSKSRFVKGRDVNVGQGIDCVSSPQQVRTQVGFIQVTSPTCHSQQDCMFCGVRAQCSGSSFGMFSRYLKRLEHAASGQGQSGAVAGTSAVNPHTAASPVSRLCGSSTRTSTERTRSRSPVPDVASDGDTSPLAPRGVAVSDHSESDAEENVACISTVLPHCSSLSMGIHQPVDGLQPLVPEVRLKTFWADVLRAATASRWQQCLLRRPRVRQPLRLHSGCSGLAAEVHAAMSLGIPTVFLIYNCYGKFIKKYKITITLKIATMFLITCCFPHDVEAPLGLGIRDQSFLIC